jgi:hypothetical protein
MKTDIQINIGTQIERIDYSIDEVRNSTGDLTVGHTCELKLQTPTGIIYMNLEGIPQLDEIITKLQEIRMMWTETEKNLWSVKR